MDDADLDTSSIFDLKPLEPPLSIVPASNLAPPFDRPISKQSNRDPDRLVEACRVSAHIEPTERGPWRIWRKSVSGLPAVELGLFPYQNHTVLARRVPDNYDRDIMEYRCCGEWAIVMEDSPFELRRHLPLLLRASGHVLVTGLGLGCVVRGLLSLPDVEHIDVVEIDADIIAMVGPEFEDEPRVTIVHGDALRIEWAPFVRWHYAWHDLWLEQGGLHELHIKTIVRYDPMVLCAQGAWLFPRIVRRILAHSDVSQSVARRLL